MEWVELAEQVLEQEEELCHPHRTHQPQHWWVRCYTHRGHHLWMHYYNHYSKTQQVQAEAVVQENSSDLSCYPALMEEHLRALLQDSLVIVEMTLRKDVTMAWNHLHQQCQQGPSPV